MSNSKKKSGKGKAKNEARQILDGLVPTQHQPSEEKKKKKRHRRILKVREASQVASFLVLNAVKFRGEYVGGAEYSISVSGGEDHAFLDELISSVQRNAMRRNVK